jgi:L-lactate dehydrogenase (cytochrome)
MFDPRYPTYEDLEARAKRRLPDFSFDYLAGGAGNEAGIARNRAAFERVTLVPRYLEKHAEFDPARELFGHVYALPVGVAPVGLGCAIWPKSADILAAAAGRANIPFCLSTVASSSIETIGPLAGESGWFQLYPLHEHDKEKHLLGRARDQGFSVMVVTVDIPAVAYRPRDIRNGLAFPPKITAHTMAEVIRHPAWALATAGNGFPSFANLIQYAPPGADLRTLGKLSQELLLRGTDWKRLEAHRKAWDGPMLVKGILSVSDVQRAIDAGVDGIIISNHGGRQLEAGVASLDMLPVLKKAAKGKLKLILDSGIRSGADVVRALALGADFTLAGRLFMYSAAALGPRGGDHAVDMLRQQIVQVMHQTGCPDFADLPDFLAPPA